MKQFLIIVLLTCACVHSQAQVNYVLNPSLEDNSGCPTGPDQIYLANYWSSIDTIFSADSTMYYGECTPEYCNACATWVEVSVPLGEIYYQFPRTGDGMAQVQMFYDESSSGGFYYRDYLQGHLYKPLIMGKSYCVTYFVNLEEGGSYAVNNIDAYLDNGTIDTFKDHCGLPIEFLTPQITDSAVIFDTMNWVKIQGNFVADGSERFITIGNFHDMAHTTYVPVTYPSGTGGTFTWYLVDDVSVIEINNIPFAGNDTMIHTGDSVFLGPQEIALPYTWYIQGNTAPIDSGGGMWVHPDSTTTYVLEQNLCGMLTYDTVTVTVGSLNVTNTGNVENVKVWPNPVQRDLTLTRSEGAGTAVRLYDIVGKIVLSAVMKSNEETIDVSQLRNGTYLLQAIGVDGSKKTIRIVKR